MIYRFLFSQSVEQGKRTSLIVLSMRVVFGVLLMVHGFQKLAAFDALAAGAFPDPLGVGSAVSVSLAIFAELLCAAAMVAGFLYRLSLIPVIVTLLVAFFAVHGASVADGELALVYLFVFIFMYLIGAGRYSADSLIAARFNRNKELN